MKHITYVLAEDDTSSIWERRYIYVGTGRPPHKRLTIDELLAMEPPDILQLHARDKLLWMMVVAICNN